MILNINYITSFHIEIIILSIYLFITLNYTPNLLPKAMAFTIFLLFFALLPSPSLNSKTNIESLPDSIHIQARKNFHIQGIAMDKEHQYFYVSYTTQLVKFDIQGKPVGSVSGLLGHLGCISYNPEDGKIYGSLEYKNDEIGRNISDNSIGCRENATIFYIAVFDVDKINRLGMDGLKDGVMKTVCLPTVKQLYNGVAEVDGRKYEHIYGCSGIDGVTFGPKFGTKGGKLFLTVALGIYSDLNRFDNDYQVLLQYPWPKVMKKSMPLDLNNMHSEGPRKPAAIYFAYTGNTSYGVQNLEYDAYSDLWFMAVYRGKKKQFPNYRLFAIDNTIKPTKEVLKGNGLKKGFVLQLSRDGIYDKSSSVYGWNFPYGSMGIQSLGEGWFYIFHPDKNKKGIYSGYIEKYRYDKSSLKPFVRVLR